MTYCINCDTERYRQLVVQLAYYHSTCGNNRYEEKFSLNSGFQRVKLHTGGKLCTGLITLSTWS